MSNNKFFVLVILFFVLGACSKSNRQPAGFDSPNQDVPSPKKTAAAAATQGVLKSWTQNPWWPVTPGNSWTLKRADNGHQLKMSIKPQQATFGCGTNPIHVFFEKTELDAYWGPGMDANLHWFLGVAPNGDLMGYGHYVSDLKGKDIPGTMNYKSSDPSIPPYFLIPGLPKHNQSSSSRHGLPAVGEVTNDCIPDDKNYYSTWNVTWSYVQVQTPGYSGPALKAAYDEQSGGRQIEDWYFAQGIGIVRIVTKGQDGSLGVDMVLDSYQLVDPGVAGGLVVPAPGNPILPSLNVSVNSGSLQGAELSVQVGDSLQFNWSATNAISLSSYYSVDGQDGCSAGIGVGDSKAPWLAKTLSGNQSLTIAPCQAGHSYSYTFEAVSTTGHLTPKTITVHVASQPPEPKPEVSISLAKDKHLTWGAFDVGANVEYTWTVKNVSKIDSYYYSTATDHCPSGYGPTDTLKPWAVSVPQNGSIKAATQACQAARAYTIVLIGYSPSGKQVARDQVIVEVNGDIKQQMDAVANTLPQTWDVWVYLFTHRSSKPVPPLEQLVPNMDPNKRFARVPLDDWWNCTQLNDCEAMKRDYGPDVFLDAKTSYAVGNVDAVEAKSYAVLKGLQFSSNGDNVVTSNCLGLEKVYDGEDGTSGSSERQINVRVPSQIKDFSCNFQVQTPGGSISNSITLTMKALPMGAPKITNAGPGCDKCSCGWLVGTNFYSNAMEITVRDSDWNVLGMIDSAGVAYNGTTSLSFVIPENFRSEFTTKGLRFTIENEVLKQWDTSDLVTCQP